MDKLRIIQPIGDKIIIPKNWKRKSFYKMYMGLEGYFPTKKLYPRLSKKSILMPGNLSPSASPSGDGDWSDITFWWTCESANISTGDYSAGDTTGTTSGGAEFNTSAMKLGTNGLDIPWGDSWTTFDSANIWPESAGRMGFWLRINWFQASYFFIVSIAGKVQELKLYGTDELQFHWYSDPNGYYYESTDANLVTETWYYIEIVWNTTGPLFEIKVNGTTRITTALRTPITGLSLIQWGIANAGDIHIDNVVISNDPNRDLYVDASGIDDYPG